MILKNTGEDGNTTFSLYQNGLLEPNLALKSDVHLDYIHIRV
jgi:hypothetical protein